MNIGKIVIILLVFYCFVGQFVESVIGIPYVRFLSFLGMLTFVPLYFFVEKDFTVAKISIIIIAFAIIYIVVGSKPPTSALYTILFGYFFYRERKFSGKVLDFIFVIQVILMLYETFFNTFLYSDVTTGLFTSKDVAGSEEIEVMERQESGFRPKGLYMGFLEAAAFNIYYCLINKDSRKRLWGSLFASFLINGRLSVLISLFVLLVYLFKKHKKKINYVMMLSCFIGFVIVISTLYASNDLVQKRVDRILSSFDMSDNSNNGGRIFYYYLGYEEFFNVYDYKSKLFGNDYELVNEWGKKASAESDLLSMLLEIGFVGTLIYVFAFVNMLRYNSNTIISARMVTILTLLAYLEYRHATGNIRGTLFWFLYFMTINPPNYLVCKVGHHNMSRTGGQKNVELVNSRDY